MTAAAISAVAPAASRSISRNSGSNAQDNDTSPFASLLGTEPEAASEAGASSEEVADRPAAAEVKDDEGIAAPQLPAWLLALRAPPAAVPDGVTAAADPAVDVAVKGSAVLPTAGLTLNDLRVLKGSPGDTPPTQTPPVAVRDDGLAAATDPSAAAPLADLLPAAEATLDATQTAALDAAIGKLDPDARPHSPIAPVIGADRGTPVTATAAPTISDAAAASALNASLANQTDAFGEPLSIQGHDAALRLGERLRWLTESGVQEARLQLHPRELGSVDIRIRIEGQGASVWFGADHPGARAALEATLPQLRERLASEGLQLSQASVGSQTQDPGARQQQAGGDSGERRAPASGSRSGDGTSREIGSATTGAAAVIRYARGLVDRYA